MKVELKRIDEESWPDEHVPHEVRAYNALNRIVCQRMISPGSNAYSFGLALYQSMEIHRVIIRAVFSLCPGKWLVKKMTTSDRYMELSEDQDIHTYRVVYYGADDYPVGSHDFDERPNDAVIQTYLRNHRHCPYAILLAYNIPIQGEGMILNMYENSRFRVKKTIHALNNNPTSDEVWAFIHEQQVENMEKVINQIRVEATFNSMHAASAMHNWGYQKPDLSVPIGEFFKK